MNSPPPPATASVPALVAYWAQRRPDATAASWDGRSLSYRDLLTRALGIAAQLRHRGLRRGAVVAACVPRGGDALAAQLGIWLHGGIALLVDPAQPALRAEAVLADASPGASLIGAGVRPPGRSAAWPAPVPLDEVRRETPSGPLPDPGTGPAYLIYTSGSTGAPKGVLVGHGSFAALARWHRHTYEVRPGDRASSVAAMSFDAYQWEVWPYLSGGARVHFAPPEVRLSPWELDEWLLGERIDLAFLPTPLAEAYIRHGTHFERLRALLTGGDRLRLQHGHALRRFVNHYGPTETTVVATAGAVGPDLAGPAPIGRAIDSARTVVVADGGREAARGEPGELFVGGSCLAIGYWQDPEATGRSFVGLPGRRGRWYRTGDLVRQDAAGELSFLGRLDRQLKVRGVRVEPGEVEGVLGGHPALEDIVVGTDGSGGGLVAFAVRSERPGPCVTSAELRDYAADRLPPEMTPQTFYFVRSIPLTDHGKVDHAELAELAARCAPAR